MFSDYVFNARRAHGSMVNDRGTIMSRVVTSMVVLSPKCSLRPFDLALGQLTCHGVICPGVCLVLGISTPCRVIWPRVGSCLAAIGFTVVR